MNYRLQRLRCPAPHCPTSHPAARRQKSPHAPFDQRVSLEGVRLYCHACSARLALCDCCGGLVWDLQNSPTTPMVPPPNPMPATARPRAPKRKRQQSSPSSSALPSSSSSSSSSDAVSPSPPSIDSSAQISRFTRQCMRCGFHNTSHSGLRTALNLRPRFACFGSTTARVLQRAVSRPQAITYHKKELRKLSLAMEQESAEQRRNDAKGDAYVHSAEAGSSLSLSMDGSGASPAQSLQPQEPQQLQQPQPSPPNKISTENDKNNTKTVPRPHAPDPLRHVQWTYHRDACRSLSGAAPDLARSDAALFRARQMLVYKPHLTLAKCYMAKSLGPMLSRVPQHSTALRISLSEVVHDILERYMQKRKALRATRDRAVALREVAQEAANLVSTLSEEGGVDDALLGGKSQSNDNTTNDDCTSYSPASFDPFDAPFKAQTPGMSTYLREREHSGSTAEEQLTAAAEQFDGMKRKLIQILDKLRLLWRKTVHKGGQSSDQVAATDENDHHDDSSPRSDADGTEREGQNQRRVSGMLRLHGVVSKVPVGWGKRGMGLGVETPKSEYARRCGTDGFFFASSVPDSVVSKASSRGSSNSVNRPTKRLSTSSDSSSSSNKMVPPAPVPFMRQSEVESILVEAMRFCRNAYFDLVSCTLP